MVTIRDLLNRIRWDREFGAGFFELGYLDHVEHAIVRVPLRNISFEKGDSFSFHLEKETGETLTIPLHRVREVYRNGIRIWQRPGG